MRPDSTSLPRTGAGAWWRLALVMVLPVLGLLAAIPLAR